MPRVNLQGVTIQGCAKPGCDTGCTTLNRHHRAHPAIWLGIWESRRRGEPKWEKFVARYYEYHPEDCVLICVDHHAEIHNIYDQIIQIDIASNDGRPLARYNWELAERLMAKLEAACRRWEKTVSPGLDTALYHRRKKARQRRRRKKA